MTSKTLPRSARARRAARHITLVLIGTTAMVGCNRTPQGDAVRDRYASLEECQADWDRPKDCEQGSNTAYGGAGGMGHYWYGPSYIGGYRPTSSFHSVSTESAPASARTSAIARSASVSRGGFGSTGHAASSGG